MLIFITRCFLLFFGIVAKFVLFVCYWIDKSWSGKYALLNAHLLCCFPGPYQRATAFVTITWRGGKIYLSPITTNRKTEPSLDPKQIKCSLVKFNSIYYRLNTRIVMTFLLHGQFKQILSRIIVCSVLQSSSKQLKMFDCRIKCSKWTTFTTGCDNLTFSEYFVESFRDSMPVRSHDRHLCASYVTVQVDSEINSKKKRS